MDSKCGKRGHSIAPPLDNDTILEDKIQCEVSSTLCVLAMDQDHRKTAHLQWGGSNVEIEK